jgi:hypothetical protein
MGPRPETGAASFLCADAFLRRARIMPDRVQPEFKTR